ncbi:TPA: hypothetical protein ACI7ID_003749 [Escherichia coli]|nr:hypothetical protein [Escherichia coli]MDA6190693.1 hypothetical protein [Escherichia coli]MDA6331140.1 hypothetical protein [Escherichia coli]MDA6374685.1 hypothetical protein [Escherichia coli]MDA6389063.1 hypothetical protein [Escherichia coli]MDA6393512.1 hypothetical protein [Escherichia coli]
MLRNRAGRLDYKIMR